MDLKTFTAYGGGDWHRIQRSTTFREEREASVIWRRGGYNTEYAPLRAAVLRMPGDEIARIEDADGVQFLRRPDPSALNEELTALADIYRAAGVDVHYLTARADKPNLLYLRELFFATPDLTFLARPATDVRAGEEVVVARLLAELGIPMHAVTRGVFEAADAVFLRPNRLVFRHGNRSSVEALDEVLVNSSDHLKVTGRYRWSGDATQHLLAVLQVLDHDLAVMRRLAPEELIQEVTRQIGEVFFLEETHEVTHLQAMNVTILGPRRVVMPDDCPRTRKIYEAHGVEVVEARVAELRKGAGGIGCATGILARDIVDASTAWD